MNKTIENNRDFNSNNRIFEGYSPKKGSAAEPLRRSADFFLYIISLLIGAISAERSIALFKVFGVALSFVGFIGIIGAVERGAMRMGPALLLGLVLIAVEYLCLRPKRHHS